jgi:hypothetical protein
MHKPTEEVRRLFDKQMYHPDSPHKVAIRKQRPYGGLPYEYSSSSDDDETGSERKQRRIADNRRITKRLLAQAKDDNIKNAIQIWTKKQKHTEFYYRLHVLKERIDIYNEIFMSRIPKYMKRNTKYFEEEQQILRERQQL